MCKLIVEQKVQLVPTIFTKVQMNLIESYLQNKPLTSTQKSYLYSTIKKKVDALTSLQQEFYIMGQNMIPERVEHAKQILKELGHPKAFISGSFLFKEKYNDIDIFVVSGKRKAYRVEDKHFTHLRESDLARPLFISLKNYSVATFARTSPVSSERINLEDLNVTYQLSINEIFNNEEESTLRELIFVYYLFVKKKILDAYTLYEQAQLIIKKDKEEKIKLINQLTKELLHTLYSPGYLYNWSRRFANQLDKDIESEGYTNFVVFRDLFREVQDECRRAKT